MSAPQIPRAPAVLLDTVIWRRLAAGPGYLAKIRQLRRLNARGRLHLAVPEVIKVEFERRVSEVQATWTRSVEKFAEIPVTLLEHLGPSEELRQVRHTIEENVAALTKRGSENLREVQQIVATSTCCAMTDDALAEAARRSLAGRQPAKSKPSIGDTMVWLCVLAHLDQRDVYFVTDNTKEFCDANDPDALHPDLLAEASSRSTHTLTFLRGPDDLIERFEQLDEPAIRWEPSVSNLDPDRDRPTQCVVCGATGTFSPGHWGPSQYGGGLSWQYRCEACKRVYDTGEYFD